MKQESKSLFFRIWSLIGRIMYKIAWPGLYILINNTSRSRVIVSCGNEVLFLKDWLGIGEWKLPGGGIYKTEDPLGSAVRELAEETGVKAPPQEFIFLGKISTKDHGINTALYCYHLELIVKPEIVTQKFEVLDFEWINNKEAGKNKIFTLNTLQILDLWRKL